RQPSRARICPAGRCDRPSLHDRPAHRGLQHQRRRSGHYRDLPFGTRLMTASGDAKAHDGAPGGARAATFFENIRRGIGALLRRPRPPLCPPPRAGEGNSKYSPSLAGERTVGANFVPAWRQLKVQAALAIGAVALSMLALDAPLAEFAAGLPPWLVDWAYEVT